MAVAPTLESHEVPARAEANLEASRRAGFERLRIARDWALLHRADPDDIARNPLRARAPGRFGTAGRGVTTSAELAAALELHPLAAQRLMADAVDLDRRHAGVWAAVEDGRLEPWVGRKIVGATHDLDADQAAWVDAAILDLLGTLPPGRLLAVAEARVVEADQELADRKAAEAAAARGVRLTRDATNGTRSLFARGDSVDLTRLHGTVDHVAHLLRAHCPELVEETIDQLRARALGLLAHPLAALTLMVGAEEHDLPDEVAETIRNASPDRLRPRTTCYLHLTPEALDGQGVARAEELGHPQAGDRPQRRDRR